MESIFFNVPLFSPLSFSPFLDNAFEIECVNGWPEGRCASGLGGHLRSPGVNGFGRQTKVRRTDELSCLNRDILLPSTILPPPATNLALATLLPYFPDKTEPVEIPLLLTVTPKLMLLSVVSLYLQQQLMSPCDDDTTPLLQDCYLLEERERLQEEWRLFREQKKNFEKERTSFTEAAIRLGLEVLEKWTGIRKGNSYGR